MLNFCIDIDILLDTNPVCFRFGLHAAELYSLNSSNGVRQSLQGKLDRQSMESCSLLRYECHFICIIRQCSFYSLTF